MPTLKKKVHGSRIVKLRIPPDLAEGIDRFAARARSGRPNLNSSATMRVLLRLGLAADAGAPVDLWNTGFCEGWMAGHAKAVEAHQRALHAVRMKLGQS